MFSRVDPVFRDKNPAFTTFSDYNFTLKFHIIFIFTNKKKARLKVAAFVSARVGHLDQPRRLRLVESDISVRSDIG